MSDTGKTFPWLTIIGCGEDGPAGLTDASRKAIAEAKHIVGAPRHLEVLGLTGETFPVPFSLTPVLEKRGVATLWLEVRASNAAAIALYESLGFNEATIRRNYYPTTDGREDAIIMALPISM